MSVEREINSSVGERQTLIRQTFDAFHGKPNPESFISFASKFNSEKIDYNLTVEAFTRTKGWENATAGVVCAVKLSRHLVKMMLPQYADKQAKEQETTFSPLQALTIDTDVDLAKGIVLIAKGVYRFQHEHRDGTSDYYRGATYIDSSTANTDLKMLALEFFTRANEKNL